MTSDVFSPRKPDENSESRPAGTPEPDEYGLLRINEHELEHVRYQQPVFLSTDAVDESHEFLLHHMTDLSRIHGPISASLYAATSRVLNLVYRVGEAANPLGIRVPLIDQLRAGSERDGASVLFFERPLSVDELRTVSEAGSALESKEIRPDIEDDE